MTAITKQTINKELKNIFQSDFHLEKLKKIRDYLISNNWAPNPYSEKDIKRAYWMLYNIGGVDQVCVEEEWGTKGIAFRIDEDILDENGHFDETDSHWFILGEQF